LEHVGPWLHLLLQFAGAIFLPAQGLFGDLCGRSCAARLSAGEAGYADESKQDKRRGAEKW
jgi:hypothetical protein